MAQRRLGDQCGRLDDDWLLTLDRSITRARLTDREREIAELAASGHSNREIAETLDLSVRTVENHLQRIYTKLGIGSRSELGAALV